MAEAGDAEAAQRFVRGHHPDVLVLDLNMPGRPSLEVIPELRRESPETQIVVLTMQDEPAYARQALAAGVAGYVLKDADDEELVEAVRRAAAGDRYLNPGWEHASQLHPHRYLLAGSQSVRSRCCG